MMDGWAVSRVGWLNTTFLSIFVGKTSLPTLHHLEIEYKGYTAIVLHRNGFSQDPYTKDDIPYFAGLVTGGSDSAFVYYLDRTDPTDVGWVNDPPCEKDDNPSMPMVCSLAYDSFNTESSLLFNANAGTCRFEEERGYSKCDAVRVAWRPPTIPVATPNSSDPSALTLFLDENLFFSLYNLSTAEAVVVAADDLYTTLYPTSPNARFGAVPPATSPPFQVCCYQFPFGATPYSTFLQYSVYDVDTAAKLSNPNAYGAQNAYLAMTTDSSCTAEAAYAAGSNCIISGQLPASGLVPSVPFPPPPPGKRGKHGGGLTPSTRGLKKFESKLKLEADANSAAIAATYAGAAFMLAIALLISALHKHRGRQPF